MKMNLPNKITMGRIVMAIIILIILLLPFEQLNIELPKYLWNGMVIDLKYIIVGVLFLLASLSDFIDGYIARKYKLITDFGKVMDAIADKILVNGLLIILAYDRMIPLIVPVVIILRDIITDTCKSLVGSKGKVVAASNLGKVKTIFMMSGLTLVLFYDLPFSLFNIRIGEILIMIATIISIISGIDYFNKALPYIDSKEEK